MGNDWARGLVRIGRQPSIYYGFVRKAGGRGFKSLRARHSNLGSKVAGQMQKRAEGRAYRIVEVNEANFDDYGVFCLKSKKNTEGYVNKAKWMRDRFKEGLRTRLLLVKEKHDLTSRGFIEYIPGEYAWRGIDAKGYMVIHCIWVVGRNRGHGYGTELLRQCEGDAQGMNGAAVVTSDKHWLPSSELFLRHGFEKADTMPPYFELLAKRFSKDAPLPRFNPIPIQKL